MEYTRQLIDFFPKRIRERIDADEDTAIAHIANAIQPGLDKAIDIIEREEDFYDPAICPPELLDWLGQLVGLARAGSDYLGLGIDPTWTPRRKRQAIERAWQYWQLKGTRIGIDEALKIWLDWEPHTANKLTIIKPFGGRPTHTPPQWAGWNSPYYAELILPYRQVRRLGGGDIPNGNLLTNYRYLDPIGLEFDLDRFKPLPFDGGETIVAAIDRVSSRKLIRSVGAANSANRPWMHFDVDTADWQKISPNINKLNPEIWSARTDPEVFVWLDLSPTIPISLATAYSSNFSYKGNWQLTLITATDAYAIAPICLFFLNPDGSARYIGNPGTETAYIEFLFTPLRVEKILRWQLTYQGTICAESTLLDSLEIDPSIHYGFVGDIEAFLVQLPTISIEIVGSPSIPEGSPSISEGPPNANTNYTWAQPTYLRPISPRIEKIRTSIRSPWAQPTYLRPVSPLNFNGG